jgi:hypothetical protein
MSVKSRTIKDIEHLYFYKELLKKYNLNEIGTWRIRGEDANCDFGGSHYMPELGIVQGKLGDVLITAINMPDFWTWGGGGDITPVEILNLTDVARKANLNKEKLDLQARIAEIDKELKS